MQAQLTFGEYMRRLRRSRKWSLIQLAENCNISYPHPLPPGERFSRPFSRIGSPVVRGLGW